MLFIGRLTHKADQETKGVNKSPLLILISGQLAFWKPGLTPNLMAFQTFRLQIVLWAGEIDCYHQHVTCLPHLGRRKTIFHPQTWLPSSCCCYYSNQHGFEIRSWTQGRLNAVLAPRADAMHVPFHVEYRGVGCPVTTRSHEALAVETMASSTHHCISTDLLNRQCICVSHKNVQRIWISAQHPRKGNCKLLMQWKMF